MTDFENLKSRLDLLAELEKDLGPGKRSGRWTMYSCPFPGHAHGDSTPSLAATGDTQTYYCFTCGEKGDIIAWLREYRKMSWKEIAELAGSDSLPAPLPRPAAPPVEASAPPCLEWQAKAWQFIEASERTLWGSAGVQALEYLRGRGLRDETIRRYRLGWNPRDIIDSYDTWGLPEATGRKGVHLPRGIAIPCIVGGSIWYVKIRQPERKPKYINVTGSRAALFGADNLAGADIVLLVEGEFDCILADQLIGDVCGVATLGSASTRLDLGTWAVYLFPSRAILAAYDLDSAGTKGVAALLGIAKVHQVRIPALNPKDKDITDYHLAGGDLWQWFKYHLDRLDILAKLKLEKSLI